MATLIPSLITQPAQATPIDGSDTAQEIPPLSPAARVLIVAAFIAAALLWGWGLQQLAGLCGAIVMP